MQAMILAAGMGKRLKELTSEATKCMVKVNDVSMIERMLTILEKRNFNKIIIVVGYEGQKLIDYIESLNIKTPIEYVFNTIYNKTNNIYSLYLAKDYLLQDDTLLLESDLIFEEKVLDYLLDNPYPSLALVAKFESWMDGTVMELDDEDSIIAFRTKREFHFEDIPNYFKTVNIYKFSQKFSSTHYVPFLEAYSKALGNNEYYEQVLKVITLLDKPEIKAVRLKDEAWYEIDDIQDLNIAESLFASREEKLKKFQIRYGGYWRYPQMLDFCYLVNPFFPNPKLVDEIKANFERLLCNYPSGLDVNSLLAAKYFGLHKENIIVGNGAAELIKSLMTILTGKIGFAFPTFEEYPNRKSKDDIVAFIPQNSDYSYTADDLISFYQDKDISVLALINPDNPSGNLIKKQDVLRLAEFSKQKGIRFIVDESFVDFADTAEWQSLLEQEILIKYPHMIVVKSISKSYGVPGLRLGVIATGDTELISQMKKDVAIWNINSFGEFYLQICEKYQSDYKKAIEKFKQVRNEYVENLSQIKHLRVIPSHANYLMCEVLTPYSANKLAEDLLNDFNILIKDLSTKKGFDGKQYIRIAVRDEKDNDALVTALKILMK
ncbi:aminotransferase class I/II-fold pyridoxal phosphate-dependent enzyme [Paludicola sp. MB14-C6]|uniref:aminotransferase class I/II-fold pyridoxal phosphate-dependent enzyme n=1 Tax=Paludihabitans sp. MB14-C6 TaxID=3070656 RepID=UPI0027DD38D8|nr:aminotransferase class I/II-fold pyridoxal phosphate-dependent enzyme [Paludicola sp. MB14-C6]WMJ21954.1 aminotransferase class I/II-fold pyridoxal phosphate-dependent enzyme [Paludicola sp. MB14-C6]